MEQLFVPIALLAGALLPLQAGANAQLSKATGSPFAATTLQLSVGTLVLLVIAALTGHMMSLSALSNVPWWYLTGGTASAFYVVSSILLFPRLGAVLSVGLFIVGQILASLVMDTAGLLGVAAKPLDAAAAMGVVAILIGAALIIFDQKDAGKQLSLAHRSKRRRRPELGKIDAKQRTSAMRYERSERASAPERLGWIGLALMAGAVLPVQGGVNALLRHEIGASATVGAISFIVATLSMAAVLVIAVGMLRAPMPHLSGVAAMPWWGWLGGFAGAAYVTTVFTAIPAIGAAAAVGLTIAGQQVISIFVDRYGWFRLPVRPVAAARLAGVIVLLAGVALIKTA